MKITEYVIPLGYDGRRRTYHKRLIENDGKGDFWKKFNIKHRVW